MLSHPLYTGAVIIGAVVFSLYCYFTHERQRNNYHAHREVDERPRIPYQERDFNRNHNDDGCVICQNTILGTFRKLKCGHSYHSECIQKWFSQGCGSCPICRQM